MIEFGSWFLLNVDIVGSRGAELDPESSDQKRTPKPRQNAGLDPDAVIPKLGFDAVGPRG